MSLPRRFLYLPLCAALSVFLIIGGSSCPAPTPPNCNDAASLISEAKGDLAQGTDQGYQNAKTHFYDAIQKNCGANVDQARFGYVVAYLLDQMSLIAQNLKTLLALAQGLPTAGASPQLVSALLRAQQVGGINVFIDTLVDNYITQMTSTLEPILQQVEKNSNFSFRIASLPISIDLSAVGLGVQKIGDLGGNYTLTEVNAIDAVMRLLDGMGFTVKSIDFNLSIPAMLGGFSKGIFNLSLSLSNPAATLSDVFGIMAFVLNSSPTFLSLRSGSGLSATQSAATSFSNSFGSLLAGVKFAEDRFTRGTAQKDDVISYQYNSGNKSEQITIQLTGISSTTCAGAGGNVNDLVIPIGTKTGSTSSVITALQDLQKGFITPGSRISWANDLVPLLSIGTYAFIRSTLFDKVLTLAAAGVSQTTLNLITSFICTSYFTPNLIQALVETVIPDVLQFDLGTAFKNPKGLRDMLPAWSCANCPAGDYGSHPENATGTILFEYECSKEDLDPKFFGFACAATAPSLADAEHFVAPPTFLVSTNLCPSNNANCAPASFFISRDGTASQLPYIPFIDPTFQGALYINLSGFTSDVLPPASCGAGTVCGQLLDGTNDAYSFAPGDEKGVNDAIMLITKSIFSLLNSQFGGGAPPLTGATGPFSRQ